MVLDPPPTLQSPVPDRNGGGRPNGAPTGGSVTSTGDLHGTNARTTRVHGGDENGENGADVLVLRMEIRSKLFLFWCSNI